MHLLSQRIHADEFASKRWRYCCLAQRACIVVAGLFRVRAACYKQALTWSTFFKWPEVFDIHTYPLWKQVCEQKTTLVPCVCLDQRKQKTESEAVSNLVPKMLLVGAAWQKSSCLESAYLRWPSSVCTCTDHRFEKTKYGCILHDSAYHPRKGLLNVKYVIPSPQFACFPK